MLIVDKLDRLARNARVFHDLMYRLKNRVTFIKEGIDPTTPTGELVVGILAQSAQFFSRNLGTETRKGKQERLRSGLWLGDLPYGYRKQDGDERGKLPPIFDEEIVVTSPDRKQWSRADAVRHIFHLASLGVTRREIVRQMQAIGFTEIGRGQVNSILRSEFYLGKIAVRRNNRSEGAEEWLSGVQAPLIDQATFDAARRAARENRVGAAVVRKSVPMYPLSGLGRCGRCGGRMHVYRQKDQKRQREVVRLMCGNRSAASSCDQISVRGDRIEERLLDLLQVYAPPADIACRIAQALEGNRRDTTKEQEAIREQQCRLREIYITYSRMSKKEYEQRHEALERELVQLQMQTEPSMDVEELAAMLHDLPSTYQKAEDPRDRNRLARSVFTELLIDNQELAAVRVKPGIDAMLRARKELMELDLTDAHSWMCPGGRRRSRW